MFVSPSIWGLGLHHWSLALSRGAVSSCPGQGWDLEAQPAGGWLLWSQIACGEVALAGAGRWESILVQLLPNTPSLLGSLCFCSTTFYHLLC